MARQLFQYFRTAKPFLFSVVILFCISRALSHAEITLDGSVGVDGPLAGPDYQILAEYGQTSGDNLFHSFGLFNILTGESATFSGPETIANIIGRITGGEQSFIDGLLRSTIPDANLYLLNPAGVLFGPNASLDVNGAFHVSTADLLRFENGDRFYVDIAQNSVLSVANPSAFGFLNANPAGIHIAGGRLEVPEGRTLSVIAGNIGLTGQLPDGPANLSAPGGRINLVSAGSAGEVPLDPSDGMALLQAFDRLGDIVLTDQAEANSSGPGGGKILIRSGRFVLDNAMARANSEGPSGSERSGAGIDIAAADAVQIDHDAVMETGVFSATASDSGGIRIQTAGLEVANNAQIRTVGTTDSSGAPGDIEVDADSVFLHDGGMIRTAVEGAGDGGDLVLRTNHLDIRDGSALLTVAAEGTGNGGKIEINAEQIQTSNAQSPQLFCGISADTSSQGNGGDVGITASDLEMSADTVIEAATRGPGRSGHIQIASDNLSLAENAQIRNYTDGQSADFTQADSGNIGITVKQLAVDNGSQIRSYTYSPGNSGDITIEAEHTLVDHDSQIRAYTLSGQGDSGDIQINSDFLKVDNGSRIGAYTYQSQGSSGDLYITASRVEIGNGSKLDAYSRQGGHSGDIRIDTQDFSSATSEVLAYTYYGSRGDSGDISINTQRLALDNSNILAFTHYYSLGHGGNIDIAADSVTLNNSYLQAYTMQSPGDGGNIGISAGSLSLDSTNILTATIGSTSYGYGDSGNIRIDTGNLQLSDYTRIESFSNGPGLGGGIDVDGGTISLTEGSQIMTIPYSTGNSGHLTVNADTVRVDSSGNFDRPALLSTTTHSQSSGRGGDLSLTTGRLELLQGGLVSSIADGAGDGGFLNVEADSILITGTNERNISSGILGQSGGSLGGNAGGVRIISGDIEVLDGGRISTSSFGYGDGGDLEVIADRLLLRGPLDVPESTGLFARGFFGDGGHIRIDVGSLEVYDSALVSSSSRRSGSGGNMEVNADRIILSGANQFGNRAGIYSQSDVQATGAAGSIRLTSDRLEVINGAQISVASLGPGESGDLEVNANTVLVSGGSGDMHSRLSGNTQSSAKGGDIRIVANQLEVKAGGNIEATSFGSGEGGTIEVTAQRVLLEGYHSEAPSRIVSQSLSGDADAGSGGDVRILTDTLEVRSGADISVSTWGPGDGGSLEVNADRVVLDGSNTPGLSTGLYAVAEYGSGGDAGEIRIDTGALNVNGAQIVTGTRGPGKGGDIRVEAESVWLSGYEGGLFAGTESSGAGGAIDLTASRLEMRDKAFIDSRAYGTGDGGSIDIAIHGTLQIDNATVNAESDLSQGGNVHIQANDVQLRNGARISTQSAGAGDAGNIFIGATENFRMNNSRIDTDARQADGGNIEVQTGYMAHLMGSRISASVGGGPDTVGGNISVDPQFVILQNSQITANAFEGQGGNIRIVAGVFLVDANSIVDASSALGIDGEVEIRAPVKEISGKLTPLREEFKSALALLREPCLARLEDGKYSSLFVRGRQSMPLEPGGPLPSPLP